MNPEDLSKMNLGLPEWMEKIFNEIEDHSTKGGFTGIHKLRFAAVVRYYYLCGIRDSILQTARIMRSGTSTSQKVNELAKDHLLVAITVKKEIDKTVAEMKSIVGDRPEGT